MSRVAARLAAALAARDRIAALFEGSVRALLRVTLERDMTWAPPAETDG